MAGLKVELWAEQMAERLADPRVAKMVAWKADLLAVLKVVCWVDRKEQQKAE
jgi:hypothetical protein